MFYSKEKVFIEKMIEKYTLETLHIKGRLRDAQCEYYVDDHNNTEICLIKHEGWLAPFSENIEKMVSWLNDNLKDETIEFCGLPLDFSEAIVDGLKGYEIDWQERCVLYYLPKEKYNHYLNMSIKLEEITPSNIDIVNEHYTYKDETSKSYLLNCISKGPSTLLKNKEGEAVSWALLREDGSLGVMYTLEDYRKKGLALNVSKDLIKKVITKGYIPYVHIVVENTPSRNLAKELGMELFGEVVWFGMKKIT